MKDDVDGQHRAFELDGGVFRQVSSLYGHYPHPPLTNIGGTSWGDVKAEAR